MRALWNSTRYRSPRIATVGTKKRKRNCISRLHRSAEKRLRYLYRRYAQYQLRRKGYLDLLLSRPPDSIPPDFADLWLLYQSVKRKKPKYVLEFGSGCSTILLAQALWDNSCSSGERAGGLYTIETDPYWAQVTAQSLPSYLKGLCTIWHSPLLEVEYEGTPAYRHMKIPNVTPDFIYLDGPALTDERQVAIDVFDMEERLRPGFCLIVDGRWGNTLFLREHLKRKYVFKHQSIFRRSVFELAE